MKVVNIEESVGSHTEQHILIENPQKEKSNLWQTDWPQWLKNI